jgi:phosphoglucomutase
VVKRNARPYQELKPGASVHRKSVKNAYSKEENHNQVFLITVVITTHTVHTE